MEVFSISVKGEDGKPVSEKEAEKLMKNRKFQKQLAKVLAEGSAFRSKIGK